ncbi:hypothetical protein BDZ94DRAFT_1275398 [Collybia nuda]|uniref:Transmembrane protein n=1 Tax=Collybia nuda TaxID=64659 RepID=A0A9P6CD03_9AGAR|nr:hypothetical protein BDZ94DRAFT_1275398 [Collybia nuda]
MESSISAAFLKARSIGLCCLVFIDFLWIISLCFVVFTWWDVLDHPQKSLIILMLVANTASAVILLILLLVEFRPWLDAARILLLLVVHIGTASAFIYWSPRVKCLTETPDQEGVCRLIIVYLLIASWFIPGILVTYAAGLAVMVWKRSRSTLVKTFSSLDEETITQLQRPSRIAITDLVAYPSSSTSPIHMLEISDTKLSLVSDDTKDSQASVAKRLSKPSPMKYF